MIEQVMTKYQKLERPHHPIFGNSKTVNVTIADGPKFDNDPLFVSIEQRTLPQPITLRIGNVLLFLLSLSHSKLLCTKPLAEFWRGMSNSGGFSLSFGVIGYSLPDYDDYARQAFYEMSKNYREFDPSFELGGDKTVPSSLGLQDR
ncbi:MAG: hypothetical protein U0X92_10465 [Anaerolineales bacterium]